MKYVNYEKEAMKATKKIERQLIIDGFKKGYHEAWDLDHYNDNIVPKAMATFGTVMILGRVAKIAPLPIKIAMLPIAYGGGIVPSRVINGVCEAMKVRNEINEKNTADYHVWEG